MEKLSQIDFIKFPDTVLNMLGQLDERDQKILMYRFGLGDEVNDLPVTYTLEELGELFGVTRERIRQLQVRSFGRLRQSGTYPLLERFASTWGNLGRITGCDITSQEFISVCSLSEMVPGRFPQACINFVADITGYKEPGTNLLFLFARLDDSVTTILSEQVEPLYLDTLLQMDGVKEFMDDILTVEPEFDIKLRLEAILGIDIDSDDMCVLDTALINAGNLLNDKEIRLSAMKRVLTSEGQPMHFRDIQSALDEELPVNLRMGERNVHAWLDRYKDIFSWTGPGAYGLIEWGFGLSTTVVAGRRRGTGDEIAAILSAASGPMKFNDIKELILNRLTVRENSILAAIRQDPTRRFVELPGGFVDLASRHDPASSIEESSDAHGNTSDGQYNQPIDSQTARNMLIQYRKEYLIPNYPEVPREHGLLRKRMLNSFLSLLPTTVEDFSERIPEDLLGNTDPDQIEECLEYVISICSRVDK